MVAIISNAAENSLVSGAGRKPRGTEHNGGNMLRGRRSWESSDTISAKDRHRIQAQAQLSVWEAQQEGEGMSQLEEGAQQQGIQELLKSRPQAASKKQAAEGSCDSTFRHISEGNEITYLKKWSSPPCALQYYLL